MQAEVVAFATAEQDVAVTLEGPLRQRPEPELGQRCLVHPPARVQVADSDLDVVDDVAHGTEPTERAAFLPHDREAGMRSLLYAEMTTSPEETCGVEPAIPGRLSRIHCAASVVDSSAPASVS